MNPDPHLATGSGPTPCGYHRLCILPGMSPSGMYWRVKITLCDNRIAIWHARMPSSSTP